ncbi:MAG: (Fe-S)-binding protein [Bacteroidales bacterium]|jgi:heterodisulfide reductase subunit C/nitrate reductase gamma subunit|nr:(Fe-S)-binding protein [Bacteroidales bacterium]
MIKQIVFSIILIISLVIFLFTIRRLYLFLKLTREAFPVRNFGRRLLVMFKVAFGQTKIFRLPVIGLFHALVFWGFCVILFGSIEMIIDGLFGTDRSLKFLGPLYNFIIASGDIFGLLVIISILIFLTRRLFSHVRRFEGTEMEPKSHIDANIALCMILILMISLIGMNSAYYNNMTRLAEPIFGIYPVSQSLSIVFNTCSAKTVILFYEISWWLHILLIFLFANILPYSKHFHVFMAVPNVFLSRLEPLGKLTNMDAITREVKLMLNPSSTFVNPISNTSPERFGIKDVEDISWKNYLDALSCTECGRCTSVCPASLTGKRLSPRKIIMDARARMKEKGPGLVKYGISYNDNKSLLRDFISEEELWGCTTCNACANECPININHPNLIIDMRRYLVMEEASAPGELKSLFNNIENNGAPWQFSPEDRMNWAKNIMVRVN